MAIAARAPAVDVVIGVQPSAGTGLLAHAWLELDGTPLNPGEPLGSEIARLPGRASRPERRAPGRASPAVRP